MSTDVRALINYYARVGWYRHIQTVCNEVMKKKGSESMLLFWKTFGVAMEGSYNEAIRELETLRQKRDIEFPVVVALIYVHNKCSVVDHGEVSQLESTLPIAEDSASDSSILLASTFLWHTGNSNEARRLADKLIQSPGDSVNQGQAMTLRGWIDLTGGDSRREREFRDNALQYLDPQPEQARSRDLETLMGRCKSFELKKQYKRALDVLNTAIVSYTWYLPALFEKARILMVMGDWEQSLETAQRVLAQDEFDIEALRISVLHLLAREGRSEAASARISDVVESVDRHEPKNARLYYELARPFARLAGRSNQVLQLTLTLVDRAQKLEPENSHYATEAGYQQTLLGDYAAAQESYRLAAKLDESNVAPLHGMIYCQLMEGQLEDAAAQLEFLHVIQDSIGSSAGLTHLQALMAWRQQRDAAEHLRLLNQTLELHMAALQPPLLPNTTEFFVEFNPDFLLDVAKELLSHGGSEPLRASDYDAPDSHLNKGLQLLERVVATVPGLLEAQLTLARAWFVKNDADACSRVLQTCLKLEPACSEAHLMQAQLHLQQENYRAAGASLEHALSLDFAVRSSPVYHCVKAQVLENLGDKQEALQVIEAGMALPGVRTEAFRSNGGNGSSRGPPLVSRHDRVSLFLAHAALLAKLDRMKEAQTVVQTAMAEFRNTTEEVRVIVANSELAILNNDFNAAVSMLNAVPQSSPAYVRAQMVKADVYLTHRHNQRMYAQCYLDLVELNPSSQNYVLLGEAYMRIQQPDRSITAFQSALRESPDDSALAAKIGRALVSTHDYLRAIDYYEDALRAAPERQELRQDLARLYTKLKRYDSAVRVLEEALALNRGRDDVASSQRDVATLRLMFTVQLGMGEREAAAETLGKARAIQSEVVEKYRGEQPELLAAAREEAADVCCCLAAHFEQQGDTERAMTHYNEALKHVDSMPGPLMALAKLHLQRGELEQCQQQCMTLRRVDAGHEEAALMLADLMLRKGDHDSAIFHFTQLLEAKSGNFTALSKLLGLLRRAGKLDDCPRFIKLAQRSSPRAQHAPGLHFCSGLLARYKNDVHGAVKAFNLARRDAEWGEAAIINMVEMYLNPDNEKMWEESSENNPEVAAAALALTPATSSSSSSTSSAESSEAVRVAEKLLRELPTRPKTLKHQVLECYALMATKTRSNIERAVARFAELLDTERDYVPALLGAATAFMMQKQIPKARNQLKRISKMPYDPEFAEEFETSYLVLADMYVARGKYDLAQDLCKRCLGFNRSSAKAWELMGLVMEKEASYRDAAEHYEQAWKFDSETSAPIGYKLAFNYLKAKRYVEAVDVCHKVLAQHPSYQQMNSDILDKARAALRP